MIQIRNVPVDIHQAAKFRAAREGLTLSEFALQALRRAVDTAAMEELARRIAALPPIELDPPALLGPTAADGLDLVLEMSGAPQAVAAAIASAGIGGCVHLVGSVFPAGCVDLDPEQAVRRLLTIRGLHNYAPRHLEQAVRFLANVHERYPFADLVAGWRPLSMIEAAFDEALASRCIRLGVRP